jgi:acetylornithine deacetylase/succinyl-diaminopimelate desuccinylase-like protein
VDGALLEILRPAIALRGVSADPKSGGELQETAKFFGHFLGSAGFAVRLCGDHSPAPIVWAERGNWDADGVLLLYGHYDVQPPEPVEPWQSDPFSVTLRGGAIYGRGVADDKGPLLAMLLELCRSEMAASHLRTIVLLEGGEEIGSPGFADFLRERRPQLRSDAALVLDTGCPDDDLPALTTGLRGVIPFEVHLRTGSRDIHSGFGGCIPNAVQELVHLCGQLHGKKGPVAVPGFYDGIFTATGEELAAFELLEKLDPRPQETFGVKCLRRIFPSIPPRATHALLPALEFNGISGGYAGVGSKTIIPAEAMAKITVRTVQGQCPERLRSAVVEFLVKRCPRYAEVSVDAGIAGPAYGIDWGNATEKFKGFFHRMECSLAEAFGRNPIHLREGGSIGVVGAFKEILNLDSILVGVVPPSANIHGPNENWKLETAAKTRRALAAFFGARPG